VLDLVFFERFGKKPSAAWLGAVERTKARQVSKEHADPSTLRRLERPEDRTPMAHTVRWVNDFPLERRPNLLLERYPHVANRLALCWADKALTNRLFEDLLVDRRGGRKGFPPAVRAELLHLRAAYPRFTEVHSPTQHWELQVPSDR